MYCYIVEQLFFVIFFARALAQFTTSNLIFHKLCSGDDGNHYLGKICPNDLDAQKETTILNTWLFVTGNLCYVLACTVGGYYSDLYKRRKPLLWIPLLGLLICGGVNIVFVHFWEEVSGKVVAVFNGIMGLFGDTNLLYTGGLCYVTDHSPEASRTSRIGILIAAYYIATPIGRGLAGQLNVNYGFIICYLLCIACYVFSLIIVTFCLSEKSKLTSFYSDDIEKTTSIKRALKFYDKISISSDVKSEKGRVSNDANGLQNSTEENNRKLDVLKVVNDVSIQNSEDLNRIETADIVEDRTDLDDWDDCEDAELKDKQLNDQESAKTGFHKSQEKAAVIDLNDSMDNRKPEISVGIISVREKSPGDQILGPKIAQNMAIENTAFDDSEWKQAPKSKKARSKKDPQYYDAYVEGKRPPLPGSINTKPKQEGSVLKAFYSLYESWKVLFRSRSGNRTTILVIMIFTSPLLVAPMIVENSVFPLFVRQKFQWTEKTYGAFAAFKLSIIVVGIIFSIGFLGKVMKVPDAVIGTMASCVDTLACFGYILVTQSWQMFLVPVFDIFHGSAQMAVTAVISKQMDEVERGKIFALKYTMDSLIPVLLYPLYNFVYRETVSSFPEAFFLISAVCSVPGILTFSYVQYLQRDRMYTVTTKL